MASGGETGTYLVARFHDPVEVLMFESKVVVISKDGTVTEISRDRPAGESN